MIQNRLNEGTFIKDIAAELGVSTKTLSRATVRFETAPGKQMQSDWAELRTTIAGIDAKV